MITKNYVKMCEKAEEIQKWYKSDVKNVKEGDRFICQCDTCKENMFINIVKDSDIDYINKRDMTDVDPNYKVMVALSGVGEFGAFWDDGDFIYLPTQEQLQEMVKEKGIAWIHVLFDTFVRNQKGYWVTGEIDKFSSFNELWQAFVMKEKWNKKWTGKDWINEGN